MSNVINILLVDDDPDLLENLENTLKKEFNVKSVSSIEKALEVIDGFPTPADINRYQYAKCRWFCFGRKGKKIFP